MGNKITSAKTLFTTKDNGALVSTRIKVILTLLVGLTLTGISYITIHDQYIDSLTARVETMAALMNSDQVLSIRDNDSDGDKNYSFLKQRLIQTRYANKEARFVYLMGRDNQGQVYFLADSEDPSSPEYSPRGESFPDASPQLKAMFDGNSTLVEGPVKDKYGTWLSVLAPISDATSDQPIAVVGMDIPASTYLTIMGLTIGIPLIGTAFVCFLFVATDHIRKRRQETVRMRSELVSIASHELRTPLTGIRWSEETLLNGNLQARAKATIQTMYDSTLRLQESIEDILQLANWQAGHSQRLLMAPTDICEMLNGILATQKLPAAQKGVKLEFTHSWPKSLILSCDMQRMKRVMNNLVSNAIKYTNPNTTITIAHEKVNGNHVITIKDQGIGIPKDEQTKVFAGFYRATNAIKHEANGTGMGLYLSRTVIEQHHGKLWLKSEENKGTTVYIQLP